MSVHVVGAGIRRTFFTFGEWAFRSLGQVIGRRCDRAANWCAERAK